jgi:hypothetical protein
VADLNDVLLVASYNSLGNTGDISATTVYTVASDGFYICAFNFKFTEVGGTNYEVKVSNFGALGTNGAGSGNMNASPAAYLTSGTVLQVSSDSAGNPPPTSINFDVHVRIVQVG